MEQGSLCVEPKRYEGGSAFLAIPNGNIVWNMPLCIGFGPTEDLPGVPPIHSEARIMAEGSKRNGRRRRPARAQGKGRRVMVFERRNYMLLLLGLLLIISGYVLMRMENEVDGFVSLYVAPLMILGGYLEIIYAILWRPKQKQPAEAAQ